MPQATRKVPEEATLVLQDEFCKVQADSLEGIGGNSWQPQILRWGFEFSRVRSCPRLINRARKLIRRFQDFVQDDGYAAYFWEKARTSALQFTI